MKNNLKETLVVFLLQVSQIYSQTNHATNVSTSGGPHAEPLGWDNTGISNNLDIDNNFASRNINFSTFNGSLIQRMTILSTGEVGIGVAGPSELLQVLGGNIDVNSLANSYMINRARVLWHNGTITNIFVGVGAGGPAVTSGFNTFVGNQAGAAVTGGGSNTFIGFRAGTASFGGGGNTFVGNEAGAAQTTVGENTFIGSLAGRFNTIGTGNTYLGQSAGWAAIVGSSNTMVGSVAGANNLANENTFLGSASGLANTTGSQNTYVGNVSGRLNITGSFNTALGTRAGNINTGSYNTFLGRNTDVATGALDHVTAVGANTIVPASSQMILGENTINVGIGLSNDNIGPGPQNKLEINSDPLNFTYTGFGSGLRFRQLTTSNTPIDNPGDAVLAVNGSGDAIYAKAVGNYCNATNTLPLLADYEIPLLNGSAGFDYHFSGQKDGSTDVIVGANCGNANPYAKFQSFQSSNQTSSPNSESNAGLFYTSTTNRHSIGAVGISDQSPDNNYGLKGIVREYTGTANYGVLGTVVTWPAMLGGNMNVGVYGYANLRPAQFSTHLNIAVVGDLGPNVISLGGTMGDFAGYFNGDVGTTAGSFMLSDSTLKENIADIVDPMNIVNQLSPKSYTFKRQQYESMQLSEGTHFGLLAQNVEAVLPQLVKNGVHPARFDSLGNQTHAAIDFKALNYTELFPFLIAAVKEQGQMLVAMQAQIDNFAGAGSRHSNPSQGNDKEVQSNTIDVKLQNIKAIILNQNSPNPFNESTVIGFDITDNVKKVQIFFYDNQGIVLKVIDISEKGAGQLNVFAEDLSSGSYTYSLVADGKLIETKKMVKQN